MVLELDSQKIEHGLRQMEALLEEFATSPVPNYLGFLLVVREENYLSLPRFYFAAVIAKILDRCEQLIAEDQSRAEASDEGFQAYLQYKLLIRLLKELSPEMEELIEGFQRGDYDQDLEDLNQVIARANRVIELVPEESRAYLWRGCAYLRRGDYDKAIEDCTQAIKFGLENAHVYFVRGTAAYLKSAYDRNLNSLNLECITADFDKAVHLVPNHAVIYLSRGLVYHEIKDYDRALEDYDNAVRLCPNYETDFGDREFIYGGQGEVDQAIELLNRVVEKCYQSENRSVAAYYLGVSFLFSGNPHIARENFEKARELGFDDKAKIAKHLENLKSRSDK